MKKVNFNTFQNLTVSDELMQKALSIPETVEKKAPVSYVSRTRGLMTAAGFVLVFALSIFLFFYFGNKNVFSVAPPTAQKATVSTAASESPTAPATKSSEPAGEQSEKPSQPPTQVETQMSTDSEGNIVIITVITEITPGEQEPTEGKSAAPGKGETATESSKPTESATEHQDETKPPEPTEESHTQPVTESSEPPWVAPTWHPITAPISDEIRTGEQYVYCRIYEQNGHLLGGEDLFDDFHKVKVDPNNNSVEYNRYILSKGAYHYYFYTEDGTDFYNNWIFIY